MGMDMDVLPAACRCLRPLSTVSKQTCGNQECESSEGIETFGALMKEEPLEGKKEKNNNNKKITSAPNTGMDSALMTIG